MIRHNHLNKLLSVLTLLWTGSVSLLAQVDYQFPDVKFREFYGNMTMSVKVVQNERTVEDVNVAIYSDKQIRGKGHPTNAKKPGVVNLTVYGNSSGEKIYFKIYAEGHLVEVTPEQLEYTFNGSVGTPKHPYEIDITDICQPVTLLDQGDNSQTLEDYHAYWANVTLQNRTFYKDGDWNTLCLPFDVTAEQLADPTHPFHGAILRELDIEGIYKTDEQTGYNTETGTLYLYFKEASAIKAGVPYLVRWTKAEGYESADPSTRDLKSPVLEGVTIDYGIAAQACMTVTSQDGNVSFLGTYSDMAVAAGDPNFLFLGTGNSLYGQRADKNGTLHPMRACFRLNKDNAANVRRLVMNLDEQEPTGIEEIVNGQSSNPQSSDTWYTLTGVKLDSKPTVKGVFLYNGKKVMIK